MTIRRGEKRKSERETADDKEDPRAAHVGYTEPAGRWTPPPRSYTRQYTHRRTDRRLPAAVNCSHACGCASHTAAGPRALVAAARASYRISVGTHASARALLARRRRHAFSLVTPPPRPPMTLPPTARVRESVCVLCVRVCVCTCVCVFAACVPFVFLSTPCG